MAAKQMEHVTGGAPHLRQLPAKTVPSWCASSKAPQVGGTKRSMVALKPGPRRRAAPACSIKDIALTPSSRDIFECAPAWPQALSGKNHSADPTSIYVHAGPRRVVREESRPTHTRNQ